MPDARRRWLALLLAVVLAVPAAGTAKKRRRAASSGAPSAAEVERRRAEAKRKRAEADRRAAELAASGQAYAQEEHRILPQLERFDKAIAAIRGQVRAYGDEIALTQAEIAARRRDRRLTGVQLRRSQDRLRGYLRVWYEDRDETPLGASAVWGAEAEAGHVSRARSSDAELGRQERSLADEVRRLSGLRRAADAKRRELDASRSAKRAYLSSVRAARSQQEAMLAENRDAQRRLDRTLAELDDAARDASGRARREAPPPVYQGQLAWPVTGEVVQRFGKQKHPEYNATIYSFGIEIAAGAGSPVRAADDGRVARVDWLQGYGRVMIVDHGGGRYTLYGHLQDLAVADRAPVRRGQVIATVGDSGSFGTPSLYFEYRNRGVPQDPLRWLGRRS